MRDGRDRPPLRDLRRARGRTAAAWPARSAGCAWACSAAPAGPHGRGLADELGIALQQTNILRDVREDLEHGRVYLPAEDLARFGVRCATRAAGCARPRTARWPSSSGSRRPARWSWYTRGLRLLPLLDRRSAACCAAMAGIYRELLDRIAADPELIRPAGCRCRPRQKAAHRRRRPGRPPWPVTRLGVVGGGLAGIAAALRLAEAGRSVSFVESRPRLGGAACSFPPRRQLTGVDNGQHVFLRCCTAYRGLLDRLGVHRADHPAAAAGHPGARRRRRARRAAPRTRVPAPLHLAAALRRYGLLLLAERLRARPCGARAAARSTRPTRGWTRRSFGEWLRAHGQVRGGDRTALWDMVGVATLNAAAGRRVPRARREGLPHRPARPTPTPPTSATSRCRSANCTAPQRAARSARPASRCCLGTGSARPSAARCWSAPRAASATAGRRRRPRGAARRGLTARPGLPDRGCTAARQLADRQRPRPVRPAVTDAPFAAAVGSPVQWFFDRTEPSGLAARAPGPVPRRHAVGRRRADRRAGPRRRRAVYGRARTRCCRAPRGRTSSTLRHPRTPRHVPAGAGQRGTPPGPDSAGPASCWPARGPPPAGRRRWRAPSAAARPPPNIFCPWRVPSRVALYTAPLER